MISGWGLLVSGRDLSSGIKRALPLLLRLEMIEGEEERGSEAAETNEEKIHFSRESSLSLHLELVKVTNMGRVSGDSAPSIPGYSQYTDYHV